MNLENLHSGLLIRQGNLDLPVKDFVKQKRIHQKIDFNYFNYVLFRREGWYWNRHPTQHSKQVGRYPVLYCTLVPTFRKEDDL